MRVNLSTQQAMTSAPSLSAKAGGNTQLLGADSPAKPSAAQMGDVERIVSCSELPERDTLRKAGAGLPDGQGGGWEKDTPAAASRWVGT